MRRVAAVLAAGLALTAGALLVQPDRASPS